MAGDTIVLVTPVDTENNLFRVENIIPNDLVNQILHTDWLNLPYTRRQGTEFLKRRRIDNEKIPWIEQWTQYCQKLWPKLAEKLDIKIHDYPDNHGTDWWVDEPGFMCNIHTDGEMPGAMQLYWIGADVRLGTVFYNYKDSKSLRHQFLMQANSGYIMINQPDAQEFRRLQWHGMRTPVPAGTFRLSSYSWITPQ
jgi:hypothetical protein